jgi:hypothetical protein
MVERAGVEAKLSFPAHPHMLRHACGFALANKGHDTCALQATLATAISSIPCVTSSCYLIGSRTSGGEIREGGRLPEPTDITLLGKTRPGS